MKLFKSRSLSSLIVLVTALVLITTPLAGVASAATKHSAKSTKPNNANGMKVTPLRTDLAIQPGKSATVTVTVTNLTKASLRLQPIENDFVAGNEEGRPALILDQNSYAPTHSLKRFMLPLNSFGLAPNQSKDVKLTINVPPTAKPGGYFGALRFAPASKSGQTQSINSSVASLVLMTVPGATEHHLVLTNFDVKQTKGSSWFGSFNKPQDMSLLVRFENTGNIQEAPFGQINVTKGKDSVYSYNFNNTNPKDEILPDSARRWTVPLKKLGNFGKYTVTGTFSYANGQSIQVSKSFWIIPTSYIVGAVIALVVLILLILVIRTFLKSYKRRVLRGHRR